MSLRESGMQVATMPFESQSQRAFMYSQHPTIAKRWRKESGPQKDLPKFKGGTSKQKHNLTQGYKAKKVQVRLRNNYVRFS